MTTPAATPPKLLAKRLGPSRHRDGRVLTSMNRLPDPEPLLTKAQVASRLAVSPKTVENYRKAGKLPAIQLPGQCRFDRRDVEEFIRDRKSGGHRS